MAQHAKGSRAEIIAGCSDIEEFVPLSFEEQYTLGRVPVIAHEGPTVTDPEPVAEARVAGNPVTA